MKFYDAMKRRKNNKYKDWFANTQESAHNRIHQSYADISASVSIGSLGDIEGI